MLADLGADVIKVESPEGGDDTRKWGPPFVTGEDGENLSAAYYHACNRGKRSAAIDFSTPEGAETVRKLVAGADVLIDYKSQDFENELRDHDVVLHSQDSKTLEKSLRVLKPGGKLISISGPPDPRFGKESSAPGFVRLVMRLLSSGVRRRARHLGVDYSFLFMKANGNQLSQITRLIDDGALRPVIDKVFPFDATNEALARVEGGRAKGKVVIKLK